MLRSEFVTQWDQMGAVLHDAGVGVRRFADAMFAVFEQPLGRVPEVQANSVVALIRNWYGAADVAAVTGQMFPVDTTQILQFLVNQRYIPREVADAAHRGCNLTAEQAARAFKAIGIGADDALRALTTAYDGVSRTTMAGYLTAVGYSRSLLNGVLSSWGLPTV